MKTGFIMKERRKQLGLTADDVAVALGVSRSTVFRYENGGIEKVPTDILEPLAKVLQTTPAYLMGWADNPEQTNLALPSNLVPLKKIRYIPLVGQIACGTPILADENIIDRIVLPERVDATFALTCKGNSMTGAGIEDGDIVFVRQQPEVENGQIAVVQVKGSETEATLKKVYQEENKLTLLPTNPDVPPLMFNGREIKNVSIVGKAVAVLKML